MSEQITDKYAAVHQQLCSLGANLHDDLVLMTDKLKSLVENKNIESFSFFPTDRFSRPYLTIDVGVKKSDKNIRLGVLDEIETLPGFSKLKDETKESLKQMNEVLLFANNYLVNDLPEIKNATYYSLNAVQEKQGFKYEYVNLLPPFYENHSEIKKVKP